MKLETLKALMVHLDDQGNQDIRDFFKSVGADYDKGDVIVLNDNLFPDFKYGIQYNQIKFSSLLEKDCPAMIIPGGFKVGRVSHGCSIRMS